MYGVRIVCGLCDGFARCRDSHHENRDASVLRFCLTMDPRFSGQLRFNCCVCVCVCVRYVELLRQFAVVRKRFEKKIRLDILQLHNWSVVFFARRRSYVGIYAVQRRGVKGSNSCRKRNAYLIKRCLLCV